MIAPQPDQDPGQPASPAQPAPAMGLAVGLADTPAGQRLAVQLTMLLTAAEAKALAAQIADAAASMSGAGLVVANGAMKPR